MQEARPQTFGSIMQSFSSKPRGSDDDSCHSEGYRERACSQSDIQFVVQHSVTTDWIHSVDRRSTVGSIAKVSLGRSVFPMPRSPHALIRTLA